LGEPEVGVSASGGSSANSEPGAAATLMLDSGAASVAGWMGAAMCTGASCGVIHPASASTER
jgi:hypothetical protein